MMWIEAVLASVLLLTAMSLLSQPPPPAPVLLDRLAIWQLEDRAALLAEFGSDFGPHGVSNAAALSDDNLAIIVFNQSEAFCYHWAWLNEENSFDQSLASFSFSAPSCTAGFATNTTTLRALRRGVWRGGSLQFLYIEQAQPVS
jgi:hypothetical protein